jgi:ELWxxDGT repeat protein
MSDAVRSKAVPVLSFLLLLGLAIAARAQPAHLVKDLNTTRSRGIDAEISIPPAQDTFQNTIAALGGTVFFSASDGIHGSELWRSDGTQAGTRLVADVCSGSCSSSPRHLTVVGGRVFFTAEDGLHGRELWKSDGTPAGTVLVKDLIAEDEAGAIDSLTELNGSLLFTLAPQGYRHEIWRSDGTAAGTSRLATFEGADPYRDTVSLPNPPARVGGKLVFFAQDRDHGQEPWTTDGTAAGTVLLKDVSPGSRDSIPGNPQITAAGGKAFFQAGGPEGFELWASDGTTAGTALVKDIHPGLGDANLQGLTSLGGKAFFFASPDSIGQQLWTSDGTAGGTLPIKPVPFSAVSLTVAGGRLFFFDQCDLWTSDGTAAGTLPVQSPGGTGCYRPPPLAGGPQLLFFSSDGSHGFEPWKSDGTPAGTSLVADLYPGTGSSSENPLPGVFAGGRWYFRAKGGEDSGTQLWTTDGTVAGTRMLRINSQASGFPLNAAGELQGPRALFDWQGTLLFQGDDGATGAELWRSDGTAAGTSLVEDLHPGPGSSLPGELTRVGQTVFFRSDAGTGSEKLWRTDGTPEGTQTLLALDHLHNGGLFSPRDLTPLGSTLLFVGSAGDDFSEVLMRSDGTAAGTIPVPGDLPGHAFSIVSLGNRVLFQAGTDRNELWKSDGTAAGSALLGRVLAGEQLLAKSSAVRNGVLYFVGSTPETGEELWRSDGTAAGTHLLAETVPGPGWKRLGPFAVAGSALLFAAGGNELWKNDRGRTGLVRSLPGNPSGEIRSLTSLSGKTVYFTYDDGEHGRELWVSDGSSAGTHMVKDILPGPASSDPRELHAEGTILVFTASDGVHGRELWRSNGTRLKTRMIQDIAPGDLPSSPTALTDSGPNLYFVANDGTRGFELWSLPRNSLGGAPLALITPALFSQPSTHPDGEKRE